MTDKIKRIITDISTSSPYNVQTLSEYVRRILCKENDMAIYIDNTTNDIALLVSTLGNYEENFRIAFYYVTELTALLDNLKKDGLIYVQESNSISMLIYEYADDSCLRKLKNGTYEYIQERRAILKGQPLSHSDFQLDLVNRYLQSFIYPTQGLIDYVKRQFMSENEQMASYALTLSKKSFHISILAIVLSMIISFGTMIGTTIFNNKYGYSTLCSKQYDRLIKQIEKQKTIVIKEKTIEDVNKFTPVTPLNK